MTERRGRAVMVVIGSGVLFGTTGTAAVIADTGASPLAIAAARLLIGSVGLIAVATSQRSLQHLITLWRRRDTWLMGLCVASYMGLFFSAVQAGGVALASLVSISLSPFFTSTLARMFGRPWPGPVWVASTVLAISGVALLGWPTESGTHRLMGALLAAGASASYGLYTVFGARFIADAHHATDALAAPFALAAVFMIPFLVIDGAWMLTGRGLGLAMWLGLASTTASYIMFGYGLTHLAPGIVATLVLSEPVVATLLGVGVLGEEMPLRGWIGCLLIALGLVFVARDETRAEVAHV